MNRKLKKGVSVVANGRTYKNEIPDSVVKQLNLKESKLEQSDKKAPKEDPMLRR